MPDRKVVRIRATVNWRVTETSSNRWIGVCDSLKLTVESMTYLELMEDIGEVLNAVFKDLVETDDFDRFLEDHGWTCSGTSNATSSASEPVYFDIPFVPQLMGSNDSPGYAH